MMPPTTDWRDYEAKAKVDVDLWRDLEASALKSLASASSDAQLRPDDQSAQARLASETNRFNQVTRGRWAAEARLETARTIRQKGWQF